MASIEDFKTWLNELTRFSSGEDGIEVERPGQVADTEKPHEDRLTVYIYTDTNKYQISARKGENDAGYLGCISSCRKPRAGEDWHRGNDLADGPLTRETWERIKGDIISYEMVKVHRPQPHGLEEGITPVGASGIGSQAM